MVALMLVALVALALTADYFVLHVRRWWAARLSRQPMRAGLCVAPGHMWLMPDAFGRLSVGADAMVPLFLGRTERIDWCGDGSVKRGEPFVVLEGNSHGRHRRLTLRSPVDGVVVERNQSLDVAAVGATPLEASWLVRVVPDDLGASLAHARADQSLREWSRRELDRLRAFVLSRLPTGVVGATAADGGPLAPAAVSLLDDETWAEAAALIFDGEADGGSL